jgi:hypothetical protein
MASGDEIGGRGEAIFYVLITAFCGQPRPRFKPQFLGEKFESLDYLVELVGAGDPTPFFFVQVKTTSKGYTKSSPKRLKVKVKQTDVSRMIHYPAPMYVVGIDDVLETGFILSVHGTKAYSLSSLPTTFPLDCANLEQLWNEVKAFWEARDMTRDSSFFTM